MCIHPCATYGRFLTKFLVWVKKISLIPLPGREGRVLAHACVLHESYIASAICHGKSLHSLYIPLRNFRSISIFRRNSILSLNTCCISMGRWWQRNCCDSYRRRGSGLAGGGGVVAGTAFCALNARDPKTTAASTAPAMTRNPTMATRIQPVKTNVVDDDVDWLSDVSVHSASGSIQRYPYPPDVSHHLRT